MIKCGICGTVSDRSEIHQGEFATYGVCPFCGSRQIEYMPRNDDVWLDERQILRII